MNISLPVIDNFFAGVIAAGPRRAKPPAVKSTGQLYKVSTHGPCRADTANAEQSDNSIFDGGMKFVNGSLGGSERMLRKKTATNPRDDATTPTAFRQKLLQGPTGTKRKSQHPASATVPVANPAQLASAKESLTTATVLGMDAPARVHVPRQQQRAAQTSCKPVRLTNSLGSNALKPALPSYSERLIPTDMQQEGVTNTDRAVLPNARAAATEGLVSKQLGPKLMVEAAAGSQATPSDQKPAVADTSLAGVARQKAQLLDEPFPKIYQNSPDTQHRTSVSPEESALSAEKPTDNSASISREPKLAWRGTDSQMLGESTLGKEQADSSSRKSFPQELNVTEFWIATGQTRDRGKSTSTRGSSTDFTRVFSSDNTQISVSESSSGSAQATKAAYTALPSNASSTVSEQIMESIRGPLQQGDRGITIRLHPPELGKVVVRFQEREDRITGLLEVSKAETRYEIDRALPQIIQALRDSGVRIERLDVLLTDQSGRQANRDEVPQNGSFQQDSSAEGGNPDNKSNYQQLTDTPDGAYQDSPEPQVQISDNSIDMLI